MAWLSGSAVVAGISDVERVEVIGLAVKTWTVE